MKFRKKPVVIEATQWFAQSDHPEVKIGFRFDGKPYIFEMTYEPTE